MIMLECDVQGCRSKVKKTEDLCGYNINLCDHHTIENYIIRINSKIKHHVRDKPYFEKYITRYFKFISKEDILCPNKKIKKDKPYFERFIKMYFKSLHNDMVLFSKTAKKKEKQKREKLYFDRFVINYFKLIFKKEIVSKNKIIIFKPYFGKSIKQYFKLVYNMDSLLFNSRKRMAKPYFSKYISQYFRLLYKQEITLNKTFARDKIIIKQKPHKYGKQYIRVPKDCNPKIVPISKEKKDEFLKRWNINF